ncbi:MAG: hypothetical protein IJW92_08135 [Clostridia bacterium]|nr:hypothetical protein [Clostridia bacterium]
MNRSIDIQAQKEYNYEYEEGKILRAAESDITLNGEIVTSKVMAIERFTAVPFRGLDSRH